MLEKELDKVTSFYREKKTEALRKFNNLKEQLSQTEEANCRNEADVYIGQRKNAKELKLAFSEYYLSLIIIQVRMCRDYFREQAVLPQYWY